MIFPDSIGRIDKEEVNKTVEPIRHNMHLYVCARVCVHVCDAFAITKKLDALLRMP